MLRSIAKSGLKGRPRQTKILFVALGLAFFFVTLSLMLLDTANLTRQTKRLTTFGEWQAVYSAQPPEAVAELTAHHRTATSRLIGSDPKAGLVGTADESFWDMSHIRLIEGRLPRAADEIVIEHGRLSYFSDTPRPGDSIPLAISISHGEEDSQASDIVYAAAQELEQRLRWAVTDNWEEVYTNILADLEKRVENIPEMAQTRMEWKQYEGIETDYDTEVALETADLADYRALITDLFDDPPADRQARFVKLTDYIQKSEEAYLESMLNDEFYRQFLIDQGIDESDIETYIYETFGLGAILPQLINQIQYDSAQRSTSELEGFSGTSLQTIQRKFVISPTQDWGHQMVHGFAYHLPFSAWPDLSDMQEIILKQQVVMIRDFTLVGIIEDYHTMWDGPAQLYPNAFVSQQTGSHLLDEVMAQSKVPENQAYQAPEHVFLLDPAVAPADDGAAYFVNQLAQDAASGISEDLISRILMLVFALVTGFSIYQISLVQLKQRQRKFALMRSLGASLKQIKTMLGWEAFYLLVLALPVGLAAAALVAYGLVALNNALMNDAIRLVIRPGWLGLGIGLTGMAGLIGLFLPLRRLDRIPLRGQIQVIDQKQTKQTRAIIGQTKPAIQTLDSINRRHHRFTRKPRLINTLLFSLILLILLASLWLIYLSFQEYREQVLATDMPDFELSRGYQQSNQIDKELSRELSQIGRIVRDEQITRGEKAFLWYDAIADNELLNYWLAMLPEELRYDYYSTEVDHVLPEDELYLTKQAMVVDLFGIDPVSQLGQRLLNMLPADFDRPMFEQGKSIILLSPGYQLLGPPSPVSLNTAGRLGRPERMKGVFNITRSGYLSYDPRRSAAMEHEASFRDISQIDLTVPTGRRRTVDQVPDHTVTRYQFPVGAVIHHLPEQGMWPLSGSLQNPVILVSKNLMEQIYPHRMHQRSGFQYSIYSLARRSDRYATTIKHIYLPRPTQTEALEVKRIGLQYDFVVKDLSLIKQRLYAKGLQTSLIVGLLGTALLIVALQIQLTSARGLLETERYRIGLLQSLGIQAKDYRRAYLKDTLKRMLAAAGLSHLVLLAIIYGYVLISRPGSASLLEMQISLADYPFVIHGLIVLGFILLGSLATFWPLGNILARQPVANIRSLH